MLWKYQLVCGLGLFRVVLYPDFLPAPSGVYVARLLPLSPFLSVTDLHHALPWGSVGLPREQLFKSVYGFMEKPQGPTSSLL